MKKTLDDLRKEIDTIDEELLTILAKRMDIVREIGLLKKEINSEALDEIRWQKVLNKIFEKAKILNLSESSVKRIYEEIHKASLEIEKNV